MRSLRVLATWVVLLGAVGLYFLLQSDEVPTGTAADLLGDVAAGDVIRVELRGSEYRVYAEPRGRVYDVDSSAVDAEVADALAANEVPMTIADEDLLAGGWLPMLLVGGALVAAAVWGIRRVASSQVRGTNLIEDLRKSRARLLDQPPPTRFADVGGCEEAKARLGDLVDFLRDPQVWTGAGARVPRGVLLEGPPGSGKTLLARAVAGEAGVKFFECAGSEFVEMMVGVGAARVRDLFEAAGKAAPAVIFIDEIDALGKRRGSGLVWSNEEREQTLNQLLVSIDGFRPTDRVVVIAATNRADILDPALVRPGRFDTRLSLPPLDPRSRVEVLRIHARNKPIAPEVDLGAWGERIAGASGARIEQLLNDAALRAVRRRKDRGGQVHLRDEDLAEAWAAGEGSTPGMGPFEQAIVTSSWQLVRPDGEARARVVLTDGRAIEGALTWADASHLELRRDDGGRIVVAKAQVVTMET